MTRKSRRKTEAMQDLLSDALRPLTGLRNAAGVLRRDALVRVAVIWAWDEYNAEEIARLRSLFTQMDKDKGGTCTREEFVNGMRALLPAYGDGVTNDLMEQI